MPLEKKFRDLLEEEVEEKYFLKSETFEYLKSHSEKCKSKKLGFRFQPVARENCEIAYTITTEIGKLRLGDNFIQEKTCKQVGKLVGDKWAKQHKRSSRVWGTDSLCSTLTTCTGGGKEVKIIVPEATKKGYAIAEKGARKLTPRECWRLMGFTDSDFDKARAVCSDTQLYKQAGNSIVVNVLEAIIKNIDFEEGE